MSGSNTKTRRDRFWRKWFSLLRKCVAGSAFLAAGTAAAAMSATPDTSGMSEEAREVAKRIERLRDALHNEEIGRPHSPAENVAQWYNWGNWRNGWPNWGNQWNNYRWFNY